MGSVLLDFEIDDPPAPPVGCSAIPHDSSVTISWKAGVEGDLGGYIINYGITSEEYTKVIEIGLTNKYTIKNLKNNTVYYFSVQSYDLAVPTHKSRFSEEVSARPFFGKE